jgi:F-type H+-transporting ATPase subunit b
MPQIDQISAIYASQLFWLVVVFALIYFGVGRAMLPKIEGVIEDRDAKIKGDLMAAGQARSDADAAADAYQAKLGASRGEAQAATLKAKADAATAAEKRIKQADAEIATKVDKAESELRAQRDEAIAGIEAVAIEAVQEIVAKVSGLKVDKRAATSAVKTALGA